MKLITLNIAHRDDLGQDYNTRIRQIARLLDDEKADIVCLQAVAFADTENQANEISGLMKAPYEYVLSELSRKLKIAEVIPQQRSAGMRELLTKDAGAYFTDGQAVMSNVQIKNTEIIALSQVPPDFNGRRDRHPRIAQNVNFGSGIKISNVHFAANNNSYQQLGELVGKIEDDRLIIGDLNMTGKNMREHRGIWNEKYNNSLDFLDYVSFPSDDVAYDHLLLPKNYRFVAVRTVSGLSDHNAVIFEIEKK